MASGLLYCYCYLDVFQRGSRVLERGLVVLASTTCAVYISGDRLLCLVYYKAVGNEKKDDEEIRQERTERPLCEAS